MIRAAIYHRMATAALISACFGPAATTASAQQPLAHMEACLEWGDFDGQFGALNICNKPTTILFMALVDGHVTASDIPPGGRFYSGIPKPDVWLFTACPIGYAPSIRFSADNAAAILPSLYNCLIPGRPAT
jgi:hypothetical protein